MRAAVTGHGVRGGQDFELLAAALSIALDGGFRSSDNVPIGGWHAFTGSIFHIVNQTKAKAAPDIRCAGQVLVRVLRPQVLSVLWPLVTF